jgi:hypothetical protein
MRDSVRMSDQQPPGGVVPVPQPPAEQFLLSIGDIHVSPSWVVTPSGTARLAGAQWFVVDHSRTERKVPTWAIVLAVVFALACLLGLLFLLVKEDTTTGHVQVSVRAGELTHTTYVPVSHPQQVTAVWTQVQHAQALGAQAR